jgi:hypothetical protein
MTEKQTNKPTVEIDPENPPTVDGVIVRAWMGNEGTPDIMHVQGVTVADDIGNLLQVIGDESNPDPNRPFCLFGKDGTFQAHGYTKAEDLIGKRCLIYSGGRLDMVAIEPPSGNHWGIVIWCAYV